MSSHGRSGFSALWYGSETRDVIAHRTFPRWSATDMACACLPVLYACSGCTSAGELADHVARELDRAGIAEMGSLAGIGAQEPQQLSRARSRFP